MKPVTFLLAGTAVFAFAFACHKAPAIKAEKKDQKPQKKSLVIGNPLDCGIEGMQIFPVGANYKPVVYESEEKEQLTSSRSMSFSLNTMDMNDRMASQEYVNTDENTFDIRNILFYDLGTGNSYPLLTDTVHILSFALHKEFKRPLIFYRVVKKDINRDSVYNSRDAVMLYISDLNGKNLVQVTPEQEQFVDYFYYGKSQSVLVKTMIDGNEDKHFASGDETNFREVKLGAPAMGREIFSRSLRDSLRVD